MEVAVVLEKDIVLQHGDEIPKLLMHQHLTPASFEKYAPRVYRYQSRRSAVADYAMQNEQENTLYLFPLLIKSRFLALHGAD